MSRTYNGVEIMEMSPNLFGHWGLAADASKTPGGPPAKTDKPGPPELPSMSSLVLMTYGPVIGSVAAAGAVFSPKGQKVKGAAYGALGAFVGCVLSYFIVSRSK